MQGKITLITPPDIFENENQSILFINLNEKDQDLATKWLSNQDIDRDLNFYIYSGEPNTVWFLYAVNLCQHKYMNLDGIDSMSQLLAGYVLGKSNVYYKTSDSNVAAVYSHINSHRVSSVEEFLETSIGQQKSKP